ncbi:MAG: VCBS repeat-containing protein [Planctomycetota bacterium]
MHPQVLRSLAAALAASTVATGVSAQFSFTSASVPTGIEPDGAVLFDLDGDGDLDLAVTVDTPDRVELYTNTGGTFTLAGSLFTGNSSSPHALVAADFDRDGDQDLAVTLDDFAQVHVYTNVAGSLTLASTFATGAEPRAIEAADLDGDGFVDLVTSNREGNNITVAYSVAGSFAAAANVATGLEPRKLALGDFDGDGTHEVAVAAHDSRSVQVFDAVPGSLALVATLSTGFVLRPEGLDAADVNGDGLVDLLSSTSGAGSFVSVWLGQGGVLFGARTDYPLGGLDPSSLVAADLDGDGDPDVATADSDSNTVTVMENVGGAFAVAATLATALDPDSILAGDVNNDGGVDLLVANGDGASVSLFTNANGQPLSVLVQPVVGSLGLVQLSLPAAAQQGYFCGFSLSTSGVSLPGGALFPLAFDDLLIDSLNPTAGSFQNTIGVLDGAGRAQVQLVVPPNVAIAGARFFTAAVLLGGSQPLTFGAVHGPVSIVVQ